MDRRLIFFILLSIISSACQVTEDVVPSLESSSVTKEIPPMLQVKYPEERWYKLKDLVQVEFLHSDRIQVIGTPFIRAKVGVKLGFECLPGSDCPIIPSMEGSSLRFAPKNFLANGSFKILLPSGPLSIKFGSANNFDTICSRCRGTDMDQQLASILRTRLGHLYEVTLDQNGVGLKSEKRLYYSYGSGTHKVVFQYMVSEYDLDLDGIEFSETIEPVGSVLISNFTQKLTLAPYFLHFNGALIKLDGDVPKVLKVTPPPPGFYDAGDSLNYQLHFSEEVFADSNSSFGLTLNSENPKSKYKSGNGTSVLLFSKEVLPMDKNFQSPTKSLDLNPSSIITDRAGNSTSPLMKLPSTSVTVILNASGPTVQNISITSPRGTYKAGGEVIFELEFSENVQVSGFPSLHIKLQTGIYEAKYLSGSGSKKLSFKYIVQPNHGSNGPEVLSPILLNGGKISSTSAGKDAILLFTKTLSDSEVKIDSLSGPFITTFFLPAPGVYKENEKLLFSLDYSSTVEVSKPTPATPCDPKIIHCEPAIPFLIGNVKRYAIYSASESTNGKVVFSYTISNQDEDQDGIYLSGLVVNHSSIKSSGRESIPYFVVPQTSDIKIDGTTPFIKSITTPATGLLLNGMNLDFIVEFSEDVTYTGAPKLTFQVGCQTTCSDKMATLDPKSSTLKKYLFHYPVQNGDVSIGVRVKSLEGSFKDKVLHDANLALTPNPYELTGFQIDANLPVVSELTLTNPDKETYKVGDKLEFKITWSDEVIISGVPKIKFSFGDSNRHASAIYIQNGSLSNQSTFSYEIKTNDLSASEIKLEGLDLNGSAISDVSGNSADISSDKLLKSFAGIKIDGVRPVVVEQTTPGHKLYKIGDFLDFKVKWSESILVEGKPYIPLKIGDKQLKAEHFVTNDNEATFRYEIKESDNVLDLSGIEMFTEINLPSEASISDSAKNPANITLRYKDLSEVKVDGIRPTLASFLRPQDGIYIFGKSLDFEAFWSEPVTISGSGKPKMSIRVGTDAIHVVKHVICNTCTTALTSKSIFSWIVEQNLKDEDGIKFNSLDIDLTNVTIKDSAGNDIKSPLTFLDDPTLSNVKIDGLKIGITKLTVLSGPKHANGEDLKVQVTFNEGIEVVGTPSLDLLIGTSAVKRKLNFIQTSISDPSSSKVDSAIFSYKITTSDKSIDSSGVNQGIKVTGPITYPSGASIKDTSLSKQDVDPKFSEFTDKTIIIDGIAPLISEIKVTNATRQANPNAFIADERMNISVRLSKSVFATPPSGQNLVSHIKLKIRIGDEIKEASYTERIKGVLDNDTLVFGLTLPSMSEPLLDLDGIEITELSLGLASLKDSTGNPVDTSIRGFNQKVYVHYSNFLSRFSLLETNHYSAVSCNTTQLCVNSLIDVSGNNQFTFVDPQAQKSIVIRDSGFGQKMKRYMTLSAANTLVSKRSSRIESVVKYVIIVYKGPSNASNTPALSNHTLLRRLISNNTLSTTIQLNSQDIMKKITFDVDQRYRFNNDDLSGYVRSSSSVDLWDKDIPYVLMTEYQSNTSFFTTSTQGTTVGGAGFNGDIAEIIFLRSHSSLSQQLLDKIINQLNNIYGLY